MAERQMKAWERVLAARAMGQDPDPADVEEARAASRPGTVGWAAKVAAQAAPQKRPAPEGRARFRDAILARLNRDSGDGPDAA
ncbi:MULTISPECIES: hypothetical protein [Streptomyces]|uniref:Uncharacterized protein n=2 Tax=Streptomyces TaxID=1883 RepID=A0ABV9ITA1_9ACTN